MTNPKERGATHATLTLADPVQAQAGEAAAHSDPASLTDFLLGRGGPPAEAVIHAARLQGYAYASLPADHPLRPRLRARYLAMLARHESIKREVAPLFAAWSEAGILPLLMKGFYMAEFIYPAPGMRYHGDVDVVIEPRHLRRAAAIARELGWNAFPDLRDPPFPVRHAAYNMYSPAGHTAVDVQRSVIHRSLPLVQRELRVTRAVLARAREIEWEGARILVPDPVDAALVCLLLHRAWGSEHWGLKVHDLLDLRFLAEREGVTREALEARAVDFRARRSLALMLERCDPWNGRFQPGLLPAARMWAHYARTLHEHTPRFAQAWASRLVRGVPLTAHVLRAIPLVLRARNAARREPDLHRLLEEFTPRHDASAPRPPRPKSSERVWLSRGIRWASRVIPTRGVGRCVIRALAHYHALRVRGVDAVFVSGVKRDADGIVGHAWVELDGRVLPELHEPENLHVYKENFRYPPRA